MNFADAIRQASGGAQIHLSAAIEPQSAPTALEESQATKPEGAAQITSGTIVRLELFLNPEQLGNLLRSVTNGQHSMMTTREAASYLRTSAGALEQMAQDGTIPAVNLDGRWRYPKPALDDWLASQAYKSGAA